MSDTPTNAGRAHAGAVLLRWLVKPRMHSLDVLFIAPSGLLLAEGRWGAGFAMFVGGCVVCVIVEGMAARSARKVIARALRAAEGQLQEAAAEAPVPRGPVADAFRASIMVEVEERIARAVKAERDRAARADAGWEARG